MAGEAAGRQPQQRFETGTKGSTSYLCSVIPLDIISAPERHGTGWLHIRTGSNEIAAATAGSMDLL